MSSIQEMNHPNEKVKGKVEALSACGYNQAFIAEYLGVTTKTLRKHYRVELDRALVDRTCAVAEALFKKATDPHKPCVTAQIFWLKCQSRGGWIEDQDLAAEYQEKKLGKIEIEILKPKDTEKVIEGSSEKIEG